MVEEEVPPTPVEERLSEADARASVESVTPPVVEEPAVPPVEPAPEIVPGEVGREEVRDAIEPRLEPPPDAGILELAGTIRARPVGLKVGFEIGKISAARTAWYRFEFGEPFDEPPHVNVTVEYQGGAPPDVRYPRPRIVMPSVEYPTVQALEEWSYPTPLVDAKAYASELKKQAKKVALGLWWFIGWKFVTTFASCAYFCLYALASFWNKMVHPVADAVRRLISRMDTVVERFNALVKRLDAIEGEVNSRKESIINTAVGAVSGYVDDAVSRAICNLYKFSDMPMMKLRVGVIKPPTTTYVDVLGYAGAVLHVTAIGKRARTLEAIIREELGKIGVPAPPRRRPPGLIETILGGE